MAGIPVVLMSTVETTALGAALLAAVGAGLSPSLKEASERTTKVAEVNYPIPTNQRIYDRGYEYFLTQTSRNQKVNHKRSAIS
ncbi:hypothetical protein HKBW3S47_02456, partial [Candidatus Hakubella thermalkaliphila]